MPEELCQVSPKSHYVSLALHSDPSPLVKNSCFHLRSGPRQWWREDRSWHVSQFRSFENCWFFDSWSVKYHQCHSQLCYDIWTYCISNSHFWANLLYLLYSISTFMLYQHTLISVMATCTCNCIIPNCLFVISISHIKYNGLPDLKKVNLSLERKMSIMCGNV